MLIDPVLSGLPAFLTPQPGLNSGFMIAQVTAAALVSENKQMAYPASVDSIPTSANQEDHVSMAAHGARRLIADGATMPRMSSASNAGRGAGLRLPRAAGVEPDAGTGARAAAHACAASSKQDRKMAPDIETATETGDIRRIDRCGDSDRLTLPCTRRLKVHAMSKRLDNDRIIRAPRGPVMSCKSWQTEAPMRMLMNNLDPDVAEKPHELVVYGGIGRAARDWESYDRIVSSLKALEDDETLLVQSGKPVGVFRTHADAPRVLIANSNIVPHWATLDYFNELDRKGLMMYGQMTAGSWIYIGSQGIVQGTYETFVEIGRQHFGGDLTGKWILTAGLGGMGGAQPLAATMAGASMLAIECQPSRIEMRLRTGYVDMQAKDLDEALTILERAGKEKKAVSVALLGNAAEIYPELVRRGVKPDVVTDQTSAHDPINGYLPAGWTLAEWQEKRERDPKAVEKAAKESHGRACARDAGFLAAGHSDARLRQQHPPARARHGREGCLRLSGLRAGLYPPAVLPRHRSVPLGRAVRRSGGHLQDRRQGEGADAARQASASLARHGARSASTSRACRRASAGSASATGIASALPSTRWWRRAN